MKLGLGVCLQYFEARQAICCKGSGQNDYQKTASSLNLGLIAEWLEAVNRQTANLDRRKLRPNRFIYIHIYVETVAQIDIFIPPNFAQFDTFKGDLNYFPTKNFLL